MTHLPTCCPIVAALTHFVAKVDWFTRVAYRTPNKATPPSMTTLSASDIFSPGMFFFGIDTTFGDPIATI